MLPSETTKTNKITKARKLVEQLIRPLKVFRFVGNEVTISMLNYIDHTLQLYAAKLHLWVAIYIGIKQRWL